MTDPTIPPDDRPFGADTDEAVSAHLDGELAGFAAAHGLDEATARRRLEAWPGYPARAAAFDRARAGVAAVPALDDVSRRRVLREALDGGDALPSSPRSARSGRGRTFAWVGAAAAAVAIVVGLGVAVTRGPGDDASQAETGGRATIPAPPAPEGALGDVGDVTDPARLRALLGEDEAADARADSDPASGAARAPAAEHNQARDAGGADRATQECAEAIAGGAPVRFIATGTFAGAPAVVVGVSRDGRTIVFVVPPDDCTQVLGSVSR